MALQLLLICIIGTCLYVRLRGRGTGCRPSAYVCVRFAELPNVGATLELKAIVLGHGQAFLKGQVPPVITLLMSSDYISLLAGTALLSHEKKCSEQSMYLFTVGLQFCLVPEDTSTVARKRQ